MSILLYLSADLLLGSADEYRFLSGGSISVPGQSDAENFTQTMDSVAIMGFTPEESVCKKEADGAHGENLYFSQFDRFCKSSLLAVFYAPSSYAEGDLCRAPVWKHILHQGEEPRPGLYARQHGGPEAVPSAGHQRAGVHPCHPHTEDQSREGIRAKSSN